MSALAAGWRIQRRVIGALMIRELSTRFGRENIGFLWMMAEPILFAGLVGIMWVVMKGTVENGISVMAFTISGYIPLVLFRVSVSRAVLVFSVNGSLMYHRQIKIFDFIFARFCIEFIGHAMAYLFIAIGLWVAGIFPTPSDLGLILLGWLTFSFFTLAVCSVISPLSEMSELIEKFIPVTSYLMIPFSGAFYLMQWLAPTFRNVLLYSPPVHGMEMMRSGIFGYHIRAYYDLVYPLAFSTVMLAFGLLLCRAVRRKLVVE
jgi:capsular polysaccharide transport system permease protein